MLIIIPPHTQTALGAPAAAPGDIFEPFLSGKDQPLLKPFVVELLTFKQIDSIMERLEKTRCPFHQMIFHPLYTQSKQRMMSLTNDQIRAMIALANRIQPILN